MDFKYKNFDGTNDNIIEIVSSDSALGLLKRSGNENIKVCLPLLLCIGKLNTKPFIRNICGVSYDFTADFEKLNKLVNNCKKIRVWASHLDSDDYCLLLLICYLYKDKEISAIYSEEINWGITSIGSVSEIEIPKLEKREHRLPNWQKEDYYKEWENIVKSNKELRYMINGMVVSCDFDSFNSKIIDRLEETGKILISKFVADLMLNPIIPYVIYSDRVYMYLIERLEKIGKINSFIIDNKKYIELIK